MAQTRTLLLLGSLLACGAAAAQEKPIPSPKFHIERYSVTGNTLLPSDEIENLLAPFTGSGKEFADIQSALETLERAYRARGFGVAEVLIPEQDVTKGVVEFRVILRRIAKVTIYGNQHFDDQNVRRSLPTLREGEAPNSNELARNLQILAEHPVKRTTVLLGSGKAADELNVDVKVADDKPSRVILSLDNTGTAETGQFRAGLGYQHTNLFGRDHTLTAQYLTSPTQIRDVTILGLSYRIPYYRLNSSFDFTAGYSDVNSGIVQGLFNVSGSGSILGARWNYYLPKWGELEQKTSLALDYRAYRNEVLRQGQALVPDITIHPASLSYSGVLRMANAELNFQAGVSTNIAGGNDGDAAAFERSRTGARAGYDVFRYGVSYTRALVNGWQARAALNGQHTNDSLVSGEQFGLGGPDSVRGFLLREVANDTGYASQFEVHGPDVSKQIGFAENYRARLLGFYDFGAVRRNHALPAEQTKQSIASTGVGLRLSHGSFSLRFDIAHILKTAGTRAKGDTEVSAALAVVF